MLTKVTVYSQWGNTPPMVLNIVNRPDTDLFEVRNIDGLGAVKADVNTTPKGSVPGAMYVGSNVDKRNIVLTLGLNPDWDDWTVSRLRRRLDKYFMPQQSVRLVFETMEFSPVEISGWIESNEPNMFSKDPEHQISIICPDLFFKSVDPVTISSRTDAGAIDMEYEGNIETGINVLVSKISGVDPSYVSFSMQDPNSNLLKVTDPASTHPVDGTKDLVINTSSGEKYVQSVPHAGSGGSIKNLLNTAEIVNRWPVIGPGSETFFVSTDGGIFSWVLTYYNLFGSL